MWNLPATPTPTPATPSIPAEHPPAGILHNAQITFSASAVRVTPIDQIRGTLAILGTVLYFTPDPAEIEERARKVRLYDEKIAAGRAGENVARLLGEIRGEEQKLAQLTSEEFRSYRVGEPRGFEASCAEPRWSCSSRRAFRCSSRSTLRRCARRFTRRCAACLSRG